jgi:hypothetical protein
MGKAITFWSGGGVVKPSLWGLTLVCCVYLLNACGGGKYPPPVAVTHFLIFNPGSVTTGENFTFTVTAADAANQQVPSYSGTVHFTSTDAQAVLPANSTLTGGTGTFSATLDTAGNQAIAVTDMAQTSIAGNTGAINVSAVPTGFLVNAPMLVTGGTPFTITVTAVANSSTVTGYSGTVSFTSSDAQALLPANSTLTNGTGTFSATLKTAGNQTITVVDTAISIDSKASIHVQAPASGFTPTARMAHAREAHTATLLNDGRVLVAGGMVWAINLGGPCDRPTCLILEALASSETYDPATGTFTSTGSLSVKRVFHTATILQDGKVLITGGDDRYGTTYSTAETYDPSTGAFTLTGSMENARSAHTATLLSNGKVLVAGGTNDNSPSAELYDPATGEFTTTGNMVAGRIFHTATLLNDGRVLLAGGDVAPSGTAATAELYDPATGTFTATGNMTVARSSHRATLLQNGTVLITGGASSGNATPSAEVFNPSTGTFAPTGSMSTERSDHTATLLKNGSVLVTGGFEGSINGGNSLATAELYDPASGTFAPAGNMETERTEHAATLLTNGTVLITGGINGDYGSGLNSLESAELFP